MAQELVLKYENHLQCVNSDVLFPVLSNQKMNSYLKEIASCRRDQQRFDIPYHKAYICHYRYLSNGVPIESVSKMLGHMNIKTTQHYAKILDKKVSDNMAVLKKALNNKFGISD
ncbi:MULTISPECIES: tyrosine-type recombinase/integrase [Chryseobacterium]|uniref:Site-specific recombinase XerD n=1 Tax=Chryseobacterium camelliae TaxID=1265445 RepID=A0ABU0TFJ8_9FLAO|nr:site-specific recombinase XerD [Chryseobacterium camelliae]